MTKEIYISSTPHETRLAVVEDDQLAEIYYERENEYTLAGSVYKGKVTRVLPGMQSAFVDIGLERDAFLYVTDFAEEQEDGEEYVALSPGQSHGDGHRNASPAANGHGTTESNAAKKLQSGSQSRREASGSSVSAPRESSSAASTNEGGEDSGPGARRWRGRRGRRRGRGNSSSQALARSAATESPEEHNDVLSHAPNEAGPNEALGFETEAVAFEPDFEQEATQKYEQAATPPTRTARSTDTFAHSQPQNMSKDLPLVLPGESLSKYRRGGAAPSEAAQSAPAHAANTPTPAAPSFQPSTMVVAPLAWDGSELLPGESISRYKNKPTESPRVTPPSESVGVPRTTHTSSSLAAEVSETAEVPSSSHAVDEAATRHTAIPTQANPAEENPAATQSASIEATEFEPKEGSASYRFDPSTPSAYRQSGLAEPALEDTHAATSSLEESYPVTATQSGGSATHEVLHQTAPEPEILSEEAPSDSTEPKQALETNRTSEPDLAAEPFFGESVSIAPTPHTHPAPKDPEPTLVVAEAETKAWPEIEEHTGESDTTEDGDPTGQDLHAFNPGYGNLEEEMIDEDESEAYTGQTLLEDAEYDDLVEETLDLQMDSGLLSELVRDQHIEQRTRFVEEPGEETLAEDESFDEEEENFGDESIGIELEDGSDEGASEDSENTGADTAKTRPHTRRNQRQGGRGQQRQGGDRRRMRRATAQTSNLPAITELLKPNQEILVQIAKEPIARKGARITSHIALPGRFLVFMPTVNHVGVSRKISSDEERQRLKRILLSEKGAAGGGFIVRTAAADASEEDLRADIRFLLTLWAEMRQRAESSKPPALIYHDLSLVERVLRDQVTDNFSAIWVDSEADYERVLRFLNRFEPSLVRRVKLYTKETPLFEQFGIQEEINKALRSKVWLKSGGSIVINQTEALVAIDINTGKYVGKTARLEDTILKTNLDAIPEIVRQIRLRDLGGIIVIDFIDMDERKNRNKVMQALEEALKSDRAPSKVLQFNDFGLVAITRKRVKQSLERTLSVPCSICTGTGMVKGPLTVCNEIYIELRKMHRQFDRADVMLRVHPEVVKHLKTSNGRWLTEMEEMSGKTIIVKSDATLHPEQFDIH